MPNCPKCKKSEHVKLGSLSYECSLCDTSFVPSAEVFSKEKLEEIKARHPNLFPKNGGN